MTESITQAAQGVSTWRELLSKGRIWRDEDGANWPQDNTLRSGWQNLLRDKGLPHLVKKYPKLVDPLLASLLETVEQFHLELDEMEDASNEETDPQDEEEQEETEEQENEANNPSTPSDTSDPESEDANAEDTEDIETSTASTNEVNGDTTSSNREALAEKLMDQLSEQLGEVADGMSAADSAFGNGAGEAMLGEGFGESQGQWRDTLNKDQSLGIFEV